MDRKTAIQKLMMHLPEDVLTISSNGYISREIFANFDKPGNFYMLGSMGMSLPIALGLSMAVKDKKIVVIEGDGNILMNLGSMTSVAMLKPKNLVHIVIDNEAYESTGNQPSSSRYVNLDAIANDCGYDHVYRTDSKTQLDRYSKEIFTFNGPVFLLVKAKDATGPADRISMHPKEIAKRFSGQVML